VAHDGHGSDFERGRDTERDACPVDRHRSVSVAVAGSPASRQARLSCEIVEPVLQLFGRGGEPFVLATGVREHLALLGRVWAGNVADVDPDVLGDDPGDGTDLVKDPLE